MDTSQAHHTDIGDPGWQPRIAAQLRDRGPATFNGITNYAELIALAQRLMTIRPHRDAGPDGVTVIATPRLRVPAIRPSLMLSWALGGHPHRCMTDVGAALSGPGVRGGINCLMAGSDAESGVRNTFPKVRQEPRPCIACPG